ncbi:MAG: hypothetical protein JXO22_12840 [Phycisphaerae bacterium]|nr:hypothetical protein [Phycisphaerae bacterium]
MGCVHRRDRVCHNPPQHTNSVAEVAGIFARGVMRLRDEARDLSRDSTRALRLIPDAGEADCHAEVPPASGASTGHQPASLSTVPPP